jgi:hypothetical protein
MKIEIEKAAESKYPLDIWTEEQSVIRKLAFANGAKFMQERMYSEEDMEEAFMACWKANVPDGAECKLSFKDWIKQFSKLKNNIKENIQNDNIFKSPNIEKKWFQKLE